VIECHIHPKMRFIPIPKCAGTSIVKAMFRIEGTVEQIHARKPPRLPWKPSHGIPTITVLREPVDRFLSVWRNKVYRPHRPDTAMIRHFGCWQGMPIETFLQKVETRGLENFDKHVLPQIDFITQDGHKWPHAGIICLRFDDLAAGWRDCGAEKIFGPLDYENVSDGPGVDDVPESVKRRIRSLYLSDVALWRKITSSSQTSLTTT